MTPIIWKTAAAWAAAAMLGTISPALAAGAAGLDEKVSTIVPMCAACHGIDGVSSVGLYPNLAGQKPEYLAKQLEDFKAGRRKDPVMGPMAEPLDDAAIKALAAHFGKMAAAR